MRKTWLSIAILALVLAACGQRAEPAASPDDVAATQGSEPAAQPASKGENPLASVDKGERGKLLQGRIAERLSAGSYTYLDLELSDGSHRWVVVLGRDVPAVDREIKVTAMGSRADFYSSRLGRRFDHLTFASIAKGDKPVAAK